MRKVCAKMVPKELTKEQNHREVEIWQDFLERQDDILGCVITRARIFWKCICAYANAYFEGFCRYCIF
jgi:hypothetical protein